MASGHQTLHDLDASSCGSRGSCAGPQGDAASGRHPTLGFEGGRDPQVALGRGPDLAAGREALQVRLGVVGATVALAPPERETGLKQVVEGDALQRPSAAAQANPHTIVRGVVSLQPGP